MLLLRRSYAIAVLAGSLIVTPAHANTLPGNSGGFGGLIGNLTSSFPFLQNIWTEASQIIGDIDEILLGTSVVLNSAGISPGALGLPDIREIQEEISQRSRTLDDVLGGTVSSGEDDTSDEIGDIYIDAVTAEIGAATFEGRTSQEGQEALYQQLMATQQSAANSASLVTQSAGAESSFERAGLQIQQGNETNALLATVAAAQTQAQTDRAVGLGLQAQVVEDLNRRRVNELHDRAGSNAFQRGALANSNYVGFEVD